MSFSYSSLGLDKQGRYNGKQQYYWAFDSYLQDKLRDAGVHWVLENHLYNPTCPRTAYRNRDLRQDDHYDRDKIRKYEKELEKSVPLIEKAYGIVTSLLGSVALASVKHIMRDSHLSDRQKIQNIVQHLRDHDGIITETKKSAIQHDMRNLPLVTDAQSAEVFIAELTLLNDNLRMLGDAHFSDAELRNQLYEALQGQMFEQVSYEIHRDPHMTFMEACQAVRQAADWYNVRNRSTSRKRAAQDDLMHSGTIQTVASPAPLVVDFQNTSSQPQHSSNSHQILAVQRGSIHCWNCSASDHLARNCTVLTCGGCQCYFKSRDAPGYHTIMNCPFVSRPAAGQAFTRSVRGRGVFRGGRGSGRSGRGQVISAPRINVTELGNGAEFTEAQDFDEEVDPWTEFGIPNSDPENGYYFTGMTRACLKGPDTSNNESVYQVLQDSGANINACNRKLAELLDLEIFQWNSPFRVVFGNGSSALSTEYVILGPIIGRTAIIDGCAETILSIPNANRKGYTFTLTGDMRCVISNCEGQTLINVPIDIRRGLYFIDIKYFLNANDNFVNYVRSAQAHPRITPSMSAAVTNLHNRLHHAASPAVMAKALRLGAWPEVDILPATVESVYRHQNCLACMLGKSNRLPHASSVVNPQYLFGECASLDYKSVSPKSMSWFLFVL
jgi:hypothetical protein